MSGVDDSIAGKLRSELQRKLSLLEEDMLSGWEKNMENNIEDLPFSEWNRHTIKLKIVASTQNYKIKVFRK